jgi:hypothetical protein
MHRLAGHPIPPDEESTTLRSTLTATRSGEAETRSVVLVTKKRVPEDRRGFAATLKLDRVRRWHVSDLESVMSNARSRPHDRSTFRTVSLDIRRTAIPRVRQWPRAAATSRATPVALLVPKKVTSVRSMVIDIVRAAVAAEIVCSNNATVDMSTYPGRLDHA